MTDPTVLMDQVQAALGPQYRLERELGHGGMGVVFLATDTTLARPVAVKVVHPELAAHRSITQRFLGEARLIARLRHPNIVAVHAAGETTGLFYYVMDYVPGESLRQRLNREGRLPPDVVTRITADLADALHAASCAGVVHRDVKPENVLLDTETGRALLADFGIARAMAAESEDGITGRGMAVGTPTYMSPEQAAGEPVDSRSDVYGLGVVAYEMLTGAPPFRGANAAAVASMHLSEAPVPLERARADASPRLREAIMRALQKQPGARWQSGEEFRHALLDEAAPLPRGARARRRWLIAAASLLLVLGTSLALANHRMDGPPRGVNPRHSILILPFDNVRQDPSLEWLREGSVNMLSLNLSQWSDLTIVDHERLHDLLGRRGLKPGDPVGLEMARRLARDGGAWTVVLGDYTLAGDSMHLAARMYDVASGNRVDIARVDERSGVDLRPLFDRLAARLLDLSGAPGGIRADVAWATTQSLEAYRAYLTGIEKLNRWDLTEAERDLLRAVELDSTFGLAFYKLALARGWVAGVDDSLGLASINRAKRYVDRLPAHDQIIVNAYWAFLNADPATARQLYQRLVARDSADADAWYGLADVSFHDTAATASRRGALFTQSLRAFRRTLALDPDYYLAYQHMSFMLSMASRRDDPYFALLPGDSFAPVRGVDGKRLLDSGTVAAGIRRARIEAAAAAREWVTSQPETPRAELALVEAYLSGENYPAAFQEITRVEQSTSAPMRPIAPFLRARVQLAAGDGLASASTVTAVMDTLTPGAITVAAVPRESFSVVPAGANALLELGRLRDAERVIEFSAKARTSVFSGWDGGRSGAAWADSSEAWRRSRLQHLYASTGVQTDALRRSWQEVAEAARTATPKRRPKVAITGWQAALGLFLQADDPLPLRELQAMTGETLPNEIQALLALRNDDSATARKLLGDASPRLDTLWKTTTWEWYHAPLAAQARYLLGEYQETIGLLENFRPGSFDTGSLDFRWAMLGGVRLLRAMAYERLGQISLAQEQYREVLQQWSAADPELKMYVDEARLGLARVSRSG